MASELTKYRYDQEAELIAADQEAYDEGQVYFLFDERAGFWRRITR